MKETITTKLAAANAKTAAKEPKAPVAVAYRTTGVAISYADVTKETRRFAADTGKGRRTVPLGTVAKLAKQVADKLGVTGTVTAEVGYPHSGVMTAAVGYSLILSPSGKVTGYQLHLNPLSLEGELIVDGIVSTLSKIAAKYHESGTLIEAGFTGGELPAWVTELIEAYDGTMIEHEARLGFDGKVPEVRVKVVCPKCGKVHQLPKSLVPKLAKREAHRICGGKCAAFLGR